MSTTNHAASESAKVAGLLTVAFDALPAHIAILNAGGDIVAVNAAWRAVSADPTLCLIEGGVGCNYFAACQKAANAGNRYAAQLVDDIQSVLTGAHEARVVNYPGAASGERRWFACRVARLTTAGDTHFLISHEDVTALHLAEEIARSHEAREPAEAAREQVAEAMAHDLGGPLTVIRGQAQLMRRRLNRGDMSPERLDTALGAIDQAVERARLLISDMTDIARLEADRPLELNYSTVNLTTLVETAVSSFEGARSDVTMHMDGTGETILGRWDANRITRVLENLLANAIKYSPAGSVVTVRVSSAGSGAQAAGLVMISDHGVGIPASDLPQIFERFHRGSNVQGRIAGTGLGLWGSRRMVMQHGGTIEIASTEGEGTCVTVRLPLSAEPS